MSDASITPIQDGSDVRMGQVLLITAVATIGGFLFGFDSGVINGTVDGLRTAFNSESIGTGFNVASMLLGCAVGAALAGTLSDKFGRRTMMIVAAVFFIISAWGSGIAGSSGEFVVYRVIGGLAVGAASVMSPAYISEVAPAQYRGRLSSIQQVAIITRTRSRFVWLAEEFAAGRCTGHRIAWELTRTHCRAAPMIFMRQFFKRWAFGWTRSCLTRLVDRTTSRTDFRCRCLFNLDSCHHPESTRA